MLSLVKNISSRRIIIPKQLAISALRIYGGTRNFADRVSWQAESHHDIQRVTRNAIIHELTQEQTKTIEKVVPWFLENMPESYFHQVSLDTRMSHIKAISAVKDANMDLHLNLQTTLPNGGQVFTFVRPGKKSGRLLDLIQHLPWNHNQEGYLALSRVKVFTSKDESMSISMFIYGEESIKDDPVETRAAETKIFDYAMKIQRGEITNKDGPILEPSPIFEREYLENYMTKCTASYINKSHTYRFLKQVKLYDQVRDSDGTAVSIEKSTSEFTNVHSEGHYWIDIAVANSLPQISLEMITRLMYRQGFDVSRSHVDLVSTGPDEFVS
eukprot:CAMPEP_0172487542 /NCGR_PEP_ID=MMETSP1066-20121228/16695_1 /TAXON_ID=671091 /ORGANISM="Coscinodiscus wailesii, Strain CCMP2513" /LENGTH=326 /DNA_ID=CAMNT_0013254235 /DNA_START=458 /DNA_END=1434 /DNA_ORIENTATION=+